MITLPQINWPEGAKEELSHADPLRAAMQDIAAKAEELQNPDAMEEEAYLLWVMGRLMMMDEIQEPAKGLFEWHPRAKGVRVYRQRLGNVEFCHLLFEPHGHIPFHDHQNCNGVMRVVRGEVTTQNYDLLEQNLDGMVLQPSAQAWMTADRMTSLSRQRDNVHQVTAGEAGAYVLDVFTLFSHDAGCRYMNVMRAAESDPHCSHLAQAHWVATEGDS